MSAPDLAIPQMRLLVRLRAAGGALASIDLSRDDRGRAGPSLVARGLAREAGSRWAGLLEDEGERRRLLDVALASPDESPRPVPPADAGKVPPADAGKVPPGGRVQDALEPREAAPRASDDDPPPF